MKTIPSVICMLALAACFTSCGTLSSSLTGGKRPVFMMDAPADLQVKVNGETVELKKQYFASNESSGSGVKVTTNYFTSAARITHKKPVEIELYSASLNKTAKFTLRPKSSGLFFWGNLFTFPVGGHIIDAATKGNKLMKPRYIDVSAALDGKPISEWRGKNALTKKEKKKIRKK
ncbi:MAG TPA: hypothetical protein VF145_03745 [Chitinophagaceae bacterium]